MTSQEMQVIEMVRERVAALNDALTEARDLGLTAELTVSTQQTVGSRAPIVAVHGRVVRSNVEIDERL